MKRSVKELFFIHPTPPIRNLFLSRPRSGSKRSPDIVPRNPFFQCPMKFLRKKRHFLAFFASFLRGKPSFCQNNAQKPSKVGHLGHFDVKTA